MTAVTTESTPSSGSAEAVVLIKAAPQVGQRHGETVCCAGLDMYGNWLRLYPVSFRQLDEAQKFARWDRVRLKWRLPHDDRRPESRRVDQQSIEIVGKLKESERAALLGRAIVTGVEKVREKGKSLALLKPEFREFVIERKTDEEFRADQKRFDAIRAQNDLFAKEVTPYSPCPYRFKYRYRSDDGDRFGTCQDWEIEATFYLWSKRYGEARALELMQAKFGEELPRKGLLLAMGTHSQYPDVWLINGLIRLDPISEPQLF
jgi:hypothetical protein